eukprot:GHVT01009491.1.p1 GENE.GHVT01009491.1~~GHVT01009491.1.p1  ORF type:complete len:121 (+),score=10.27 GHVT01009491.1:995-1357(+)
MSTRECLPPASGIQPMVVQQEMSPIPQPFASAPPIGLPTPSGAQPAVYVDPQTGRHFVLFPVPAGEHLEERGWCRPIFKVVGWVAALLVGGACSAICGACSVAYNGFYQDEFVQQKEPGE